MISTAPHVISFDGMAVVVIGVGVCVCIYMCGYVECMVDFFFRWCINKTFRGDFISNIK